MSCRFADADTAAKSLLRLLTRVRPPLLTHATTGDWLATALGLAFADVPVLLLLLLLTAMMPPTQHNATTAPTTIRTTLLALRFFGAAGAGGYPGGGG
jgi:hypothetical protein